MPRVDRAVANRHHPPVHRPLIPTIAAVLAAGWLVTEAVGSPLAAALLAAVTPSVVATLALSRRSRSVRGSLAVLLAALALAIGAAEAALCLIASGSPLTLVVLISFAALLTPAVPLVYALTFPPEDEDPR